MFKKNLFAFVLLAASLVASSQTYTFRFDGTDNPVFHPSAKTSGSQWLKGKSLSKTFAINNSSTVSVSADINNRDDGDRNSSGRITILLNGNRLWSKDTPTDGNWRNVSSGTINF